MKNTNGWIVRCGQKAGIGIDDSLLLAITVVKHLVAHRLRHCQLLRRLVGILIGVTAT